MASLQFGFHGHSHKASSTDADVKLSREKEGRCCDCGNQTHEVKTVQKGFFSKEIQKTPLNNQYVANGVCLICHGEKLKSLSPTWSEKYDQISPSLSAKSATSDFDWSTLTRVYRDASLIILHSAVASDGVLTSVKLQILDVLSTSELEVCVFEAQQRPTKTILGTEVFMRLINSVALPVNRTSMYVQEIGLATGLLVSKGNFIGIQNKSGGINLALDDSPGNNHFIWKFETPLSVMGSEVSVTEKLKERKVGFVPIMVHPVRGAVKFNNQVRNQQPGMPMQQQQQQQVHQAQQVQQVQQAPAGGDFSDEALASADLHTQKNMIGERLYPLIREHQPEQADMITGMLLGMDNSALLYLIESPDALLSKIEEALNVLKNHKRADE